MARVSIKRFDRPDETRSFTDKGQFEVLDLRGTTMGRGVFEPGWRWSTHVKPLAKTETCQVHHTGMCLSGRMHIRTDDGQEADFGPGDVIDIPPGHDGWVVGDERCVMLEFTGAEEYARQQRERAGAASEPSHAPY